ncbi:MAG: universal stress protein [Desulfobacterales bacterium]
MMKKILFIESLMSEKTSQLDEAIGLASTKGLQLSALFVIPLYEEVSDWVEVQEKQVKEAEARVTAYGEQMASELEAEGQSFRWRVVMGHPDAVMDAINEFMPADILLTGKLEFEALSLPGIHNLEELSSHLHCPVLPVDRLAVDEAPKAKINWLSFGIFGILSAAIYIFFFPRIDHLNHVLLMKGTVLGAIAVMVVVAVHAFIYGSFTEFFPRFLGLDKGGHGH